MSSVNVFNNRYAGGGSLPIDTAGTQAPTPGLYGIDASGYDLSNGYTPNVSNPLSPYQQAMYGSPESFQTQSYLGGQTGLGRQASQLTPSTFNQDMTAGAIEGPPTSSGLFGNGNIDRSEAAAAGALLEIGARTAEGLVEGSKRTKEAKRREEKAMSDLAEARKRRDFELAQQARIDNQKRVQQEWANAASNFELRIDMLNRDLEKELQAFQDQQNMIKNFRRATAGNEAYKTAIAQRMARS